MKHNGAMPSRKPSQAASRRLVFMKIFHTCCFYGDPSLSLRMTGGRREEICRTRWCHVEQETIREQFPAAMKHCIVMSDSETIREQLPAPMNHHIAAPSRKLIFRRKISQNPLDNDEPRDYTLGITEKPKIQGTGKRKFPWFAESRRLVKAGKKKTSNTHP